MIVALPGEQRTLMNARIDTGRLARLNESTLLCLSGVGAENAAAAADSLIERGCNALLSWGCAAGIGPGLKPGDLIIPEQVHCANGKILHTDRNWRARLLDRLADRQVVHHGAIAEAQSLVGTAADKRSLRYRTGAIALDMESAATASVAARRNVPFVAIRAIADPATRDLPTPVLLSLTPNGDLRLPLLVALVARYPHSIPGLIRLGIDFRSAQRSLRSSAQRLQFHFYPDTAHV